MSPLRIEEGVKRDLEVGIFGVPSCEMVADLVAPAGPIRPESHIRI